MSTMQQALPPKGRSARPAVDPSNPAAVAGDVLSRIASYDQTAPVPTAETVRDWAEMIRAARIDHEWLIEGVARVYMDGGDPPKNKLGAVIAAGKAARAQSRQGEEIRQLGPAPCFDDEGTVGGYALADAYDVDDAIGLTCPTCSATPGEFCRDGEELKKIPHTRRLGLAYRTNNARGRRAHQARAEHLDHHRRTYKPAWNHTSRRTS